MLRFSSGGHCQQGAVLIIGPSSRRVQWQQARIPCRQLCRARFRSAPWRCWTLDLGTAVIVQH